jgi:hypothetical protein
MSYIGNTSTTQSFTPAIDYFSGNASTTAFTLSRPVASVAQVQVTIDNVAQNPSSAYTVSSNTITFTSAPLSGTNNIYVYYTSPITQVIAPSQGSVTTTSLASSTGTGAGVFQTSPTITTPTINQLTSAASTALTLQSAGTTAVTIDTSQNVGIGTTSPAFRLDVKGSSTPTIKVDDGAGSGTRIAGRLLLGVSALGVSIENSVSGFDDVCSMIFSTTPAAGSRTERMRIDSSGRVLVGITSTRSNGGFLQVSAQGQTGVVTYTTSTTNNNAAYFENGNGIVGSITTNGSATAYNTSSDYRLKEDIAPMTGALSKVAALKPVAYKWKVDGANGQGFIAHELAEVVPDCVSGEKDAVDADGNPRYQGVDTSYLVATLTAAIQELKAINDTQAETINALTARIEALEGK